MEYEITEIPALQPGETTLVEMHSLLNVLNVLHGELCVLGLHLADDPDLLAPSLAVCERIKASLFDEAKTLAFAANVDHDREIVEQDVAAACARFPAQAADPETRESRSNLANAFRFLAVRALETVRRASAPDQWIALPLDELRADFLDVFAAFEKNSKGRYRIIYNLARQQPNDYYVDFVIESENGRSVAMPLLFKDVMRDLIANARKYTPVGGTINVGLYEMGTELRFVVQDTGRGIPPAEIREVVAFGRRGSNVTDQRTMGGGFGLTKAFLVTKRFDGRLWIRSDLGVGTRITIKIPRPPDVSSQPWSGARA
ncbi:MAG: ATP-binding protein [Verrucomicrobia bacterium]|nr:ATP-binding protein [Verrucomicrobiota bacterium]